MTPGLPACPKRSEQGCADLPRPAQAFSQGLPSRSMRPLTSAPFPSRSFETNLNTYKRLAIKLPDDQIVKVGDAVRRPESEPCVPWGPRPRAPGLSACPALTACPRCLAEQL